MHGPSTLLLVTHVAVRKGVRGMQIDDQTAAGIEQWCRHFDHVTYYGIADDPRKSGSSLKWVDTDDGVLGARATIVALPRAYRVAPMVRHYGAVRRMLRRAIPAHRHLCYTIGGLVGDWPALAALESIRQQRRYAAWIDRVEPSVIRNRLAGGPLARRMAAALALPAMEGYTRHLLRHSAVALLQGRDAFDHYAGSAPDPYCTYDTHTDAADRISPTDLAAKQARVRSGAPLDIVYVGRADAMKGPGDWLGTLELLRGKGVPFRATWIGDGPELAAMKERARTSGLAASIAFPGFVGDRDHILRAFREADLLLFCHKTSESARCLIEALVSGCALVGYNAAYPRGLVEQHGGGAFTPQNDVVRLADRVDGLHRDRDELTRLIGEAAASGALYSEDSVYAYRARLMAKA